MQGMNISLHEPKPAYRIHIPKKNNKTRPLSIPVIVDRVYQELLRNHNGNIALSLFPMNFVLKGVLMMLWRGFSTIQRMVTGAGFLKAF